MRTTVYIPRDSVALALGADELAEAIMAEATKRREQIHIIRNGSRGLLWLEPLVEVKTAEGRVAYGQVRPEDVQGLFDVGFLSGGTHPLYLGLTAEIPYLKNQERLTFMRCGITDPISVEDYEKLSGYQGLVRALTLTPEEIVHEVTESGLRGRGGAAFPTGVKWKTVLSAKSDKKYIICNADEGDSGAFADRMLMEGDPHLLIEGMIIAGLAVGAEHGYIYVRSEYPEAFKVLQEAVLAARKEGYLGKNIRFSGRNFELEIRLGAGSYICGDETALMESLEGKRGIVRKKPPLPALEGLFGRPTVINNVLTFATVPVILAEGAQAYKNYGSGRSRGTMPFQLAGNLKQGGLVEKAFGITLRELLFDFGGGSTSGRPLRAVQVGGPLGAYLPEKLWDTEMDYEAFSAVGAVLGHGSLVAFDDTVNMAEMARYAMEFCAVESCGKCTPCRIGSLRGQELLEKIILKINRNEDPADQISLLRELCQIMTGASLCALGGMTPYPVLSALNSFPEDFSENKRSKESVPGEKARAEA